MNMDVNEYDTDSSSSDLLVLELAAHPLSSCNPPPTDLPDMLDSVIASEEELRKRLLLCGRLAEVLVRRIAGVQKRLEMMRDAFPQYRTDVVESGKKVRKSKQRMCFEVCREIYSRMFLQARFVHFCVSRKLANVLNSHIRAHRDILETFLGEHHEHANIELADSHDLLCSSGCNWYGKNGPYEWSKKPYTNEWWQEMNHTDWDWLQVRRHITQTLANTRARAILPAELFHAHARKFIPFWFWIESDDWWPYCDIVQVEGPGTTVQEKVVAQIRYNKTCGIMERERQEKLEKLRQERVQQTESESEELVDRTEVDVDELGVVVMDPGVVFDGMIQMPDWNHGGRPTNAGSWLTWWGYQKWFLEYTKSAAVSTR